MWGDIGPEWHPVAANQTLAVALMNQQLGIGTTVFGRRECITTPRASNLKSRGYLAGSDFQSKTSLIR